MIAPEVIKKIEQLLGRGTLSQRKIAAQVGVSRGTVNSVANGTRPDVEIRHGRRFEEFDPPRGMPRRCPTCGRLVQMPCLACRLQKLIDQQNIDPRKPSRKW